MKVKICEVPIQNIVRPVGKSNYGIWRTFTVFFDLLRLKFLMSFFSRPLQVFGTFGITLIIISFLIGLYILGLRIFAETTLGTLGTSIFFLAVSLGLAGLQLLCVGLVAELMVKLYFDGNKGRCYVVEAVTNKCENPILAWDFSSRRPG